MVLAAFILVLAAAATFAAGIATSRTSDTLVYVSILFSLVAFIILAIASFRARQAARDSDTDWSGSRLRTLEADPATLRQGLDDEQLDMAPSWQANRGRRRSGVRTLEPEPEAEPQYEYDSADDAELDELEYQLEMEEDEADFEVPVGGPAPDAAYNEDDDEDEYEFAEEDEYEFADEDEDELPEDRWEPEPEPEPELDDTAALTGIAAFDADTDRDRRDFARRVEDQLAREPAVFEDEGAPYEGAVAEDFGHVDLGDVEDEDALDVSGIGSLPYAQDEDEDEDAALDVPEPAPPPPAAPAAPRPRVAAGTARLDLFDDYDDLTAAEIVPRLNDLEPDDLRWVQRRERSGYKRPAILNKVDDLLGAGGGGRRTASTAKRSTAKRSTAKKSAAKKKTTAKKAAAKKKAASRKTTAKKTGARAKKAAPRTSRSERN